MSILNLDIDQRSVLKRAYLHKLVREDFSQLHLNSVVHAVQSLEGGFLESLNSQGTGFDDYVRELRRRYEKVVIRKPDASRKRSPEVYALGQGKLLHMK